VLAAPFAAALSRVVAARMGEVMAERYIITARARGVSWAAIVLRHALPNAGVTILVVSGTQLGYVLSANVIAETIFSWPGIGDYFVQAIEFRDLYAIQATVLLYAGIALAIRSISMVLAAMLDPRARTI
jgi:peptide/nickel transport system permease protein